MEFVYSLFEKNGRYLRKYSTVSHNNCNTITDSIENTFKKSL